MVRYSEYWLSNAYYNIQSAKHTSRLLEQQLNNMEELLMQGQKKIDIANKEMADLANMTDETLKHKVY